MCLEAPSVTRFHGIDRLGFAQEGDVREISPAGLLSKGHPYVNMTTV